MKIQRFANVYDEIIKDTNKQITEANKNIAAQQAERDQLIADNQAHYDQTLNNYDNLQQQQQNQIDTWAETQREQRQKQTDYNIDLINQAKEETAKQTKTEQANAYIDYQKGLNEFGGSSEQLAAAGLSGTGFAKNQDIAMNITYQNRVSAANSALQKANTEYQNQINQALLTNDAALAEIAYQQLAKSTELALQGFEFKENLYNTKLNYETSLRNQYQSTIMNYQKNIDSYKQTISSAKVAKAQEAAAAKAAAAYRSSGSRSSGSSGSKSASTPQFSGGSKGQQIVTDWYKGTINPDTKNGTFGTKDKNGVAYQPNNVGGNKLSSSGKKVGQVFGNGYFMGSTGANLDNQTLWTTKDGKYYIWDGSQNKYIDVTSDFKTAKTTGGNQFSGGGRKF